MEFSELFGDLSRASWDLIFFGKSKVLIFLVDKEALVRFLSSSIFTGIPSLLAESNIIYLVEFRTETIADLLDLLLGL